MPIKAALVDLETCLVKNIVMVNRLTDGVPSGYRLVKIDKIINHSKEEEELWSMLKEIDLNLSIVIPKIERPILVNKTKWTFEKGFYEEDGV
jgi:hypothetical protein